MGTDEQWELGAPSIAEKAKLKAKTFHFYPPHLFKSQSVIHRSLQIHYISYLVLSAVTYTV